MQVEDQYEEIMIMTHVIATYFQLELIPGYYLLPTGAGENGTIRN